MAYDDHDERDDYSYKKRCCVDSGLSVSKELIFACEGKLEDAANEHLVLGYNIILNNTSCHKIRCLDIQDTLFGLHTLAEHGVDIQISTLSCKGSLKVLPIVEVIENGGHILNVCESFIKACTVCVIQIVVIISPEDRARCRLFRLENIVTVEGKVALYKDKNKCKRERRKLKKIKPIVAHSPIFREEKPIDS